ncbi:ABC transporter ATP-binding protein [Arthrobacter rhombi]|uniref:ABC transporter ATP-binding protein n=1 Tax=Arthrobacter rhombi TaxID=71253 RepID=UPI003FD403CC
MSAVLEVENLDVTYGGRRHVHAVQNVSLRIAPGEVLALVGESGCGKSSTARVVVGMERPASGAVRFHGDPVPPVGLRRRPASMTAIQMVFQDPNSSLNPRIRVGDQITDGVRAARARGLPSPEAGQWLDAVGLEAAMTSRYPHQFSGGQRQRIAVARALAARPDLLVADEPISALDASSQASVAAMMRRLCLEDDAGMLFISHDLSVVRIMADRVAVMYRGKIVESGSTSTIWSDPVHPYTQALLAAIPHPDGQGTLPQAPDAEAPKAWFQELPAALDRV